MKKVIVLALALSLGSFVSQAQEIGVRAGNFGANSIAVDAIFSLGKIERLHANATAGFGVGADLLYDFLYKPVTIGGEDDFNWYMGVGPSVYVGDRYFGDADVDFLLGVSYEIGLEYHFDFPLAVGVDFRPTLWIVERVDVNPGLGVMARYVINR